MSGFTEIDLKLLFPTIVKSKTETNEFYGVLKCNTNPSQVFVTFSVPNYPSAKNVTFTTTKQLKNEDESYLKTKCETVNFFDYLKLFHQIVLNTPDVLIFQECLFIKFYQELNELNTNYDIEFDRFNETLLLNNDVLIQLDFYHIESTMYRLVEHNLPECDKELFPKQDNLQVIHSQYLNYMEQLFSFKELMARIDTFCWVLEPQHTTTHASYKCNSRTIMIDEEHFVSLQLTFDPWCVTKLLHFRFFGPSNRIEKYQNLLSENLSNWNVENDGSGDTILQNVLNLLDLPFFPLRPDETSCTQQVDTDQQFNNMECVICYSIYLNEQPVDVNCSNGNCSGRYHTECLYKYFLQLPNCQVRFGFTNGPCPMCEQVIFNKLIISKMLSHTD